jgi:hypothetical protein
MTHRPEKTLSNIEINKGDIHLFLNDIDANIVRSWAIIADSAAFRPTASKQSASEAKCQGPLAVASQERARDFERAHLEICEARQLTNSLIARVELLIEQASQIEPRSTLGGD